LKNQVNFERSEKDKAIEMAEEQSNQDEDQLDKSHKDAISKLEQDLDKYTKAYTKLKNDNITSENQMRQQYSRSFKNWTNTVIGYD
jgi:DNA-binding transcriptional regulator GbsR (MarR family)